MLLKFLRVIFPSGTALAGLPPRRHKDRQMRNCNSMVYPPDNLQSGAR
jgi:hypothetical protein